MKVKVKATLPDGLRARVTGGPAATCTASIPSASLDVDVVSAGDERSIAPGSGTVGYQVSCVGDGVDNTVTESFAVRWGPLAAGEVDEVASLSHVLVAGNVDLSGFAGAALPALDLVAVGGNLVVRGDSIDALRLPALAFVGGAVSIEDNLALREMELSALSGTAGLSVVNQPLLATLDVDSLRRVSGAVDVRANGSSGGDVLSLRAVALQRVDGSLTVRDNPSLPENIVQVLVVQLEDNGRVGGAVNVGNNGPPQLGE